MAQKDARGTRSPGPLAGEVTLHHCSRITGPLTCRCAIDCLSSWSHAHSPYGILSQSAFWQAWTASRRAVLDGLPPQAVADIGPWLIAGGLIGARLLYVITFWEAEFSGQPWTHLFNIRQGGLVFYGGFIGAVLMGMIYLRKNRLPSLKMADALAHSIALGHAFGRLGCLMTGCCFEEHAIYPGRLPFLAIMRPIRIRFTPPRFMNRPSISSLLPWPGSIDANVLMDRLCHLPAGLCPSVGVQ